MIFSFCCRSRKSVDYSKFAAIDDDGKLYTAASFIFEDLLISYKSFSLYSPYLSCSFHRVHHSLDVPSMWRLNLYILDDFSDLTPPAKKLKSESKAKKKKVEPKKPKKYDDGDFLEDEYSDLEEPKPKQKKKTERKSAKR